MAQNIGERLRGIQSGLAKASELEERANDMRKMVDNMEAEMLRSIGASVEGGFVKMKTEDFYKLLEGIRAEAEAKPRV